MSLLCRVSKVVAGEIASDSDTVKATPANPVCNEIDDACPYIAQST